MLVPCDVHVSYQALFGAGAAAVPRLARSQILLQSEVELPPKDADGNPTYESAPKSDGADAH